MAKTNFTKVEEALAEGLRMMEVNKLLDIADENTPNAGAPGKEKPVKLPPAKSQLMAAIRFEIRSLELNVDEICAKLAIEKTELRRLLKNPAALTETDWQKLAEVKEKLKTVKDELNKKLGKPSDEDLVRQQVKKQKTKRFNVNDKWLPLR